MTNDLGQFPALVRMAVEATPADKLRVRPSAGGFSLVEHAWHLSDLEREGYAVRIQRLMTEDNPTLPDFDGDRIARERNYNEQPVETAVQRFIVARAVNVSRLNEVTDWDRSGEQEGVGRITIRRVQQMMREHDADHAAQIRSLLQELGVPVPAQME